MLPAGKLSVVERMVSVFRKAGTDMIVVVTKPDDKPLEKQLSQYGVMFLRSNSHISREASARVGLEYLSKKCRRIFLIDMDRPLLSPDTLNRMLSHEGELIVPFCKERPGKPLLFSAVGARKALEQTNPMLDVLHLPVDDDGILLTASDAQDMTDRYKAHNAMITGISLDLSIHCGRQIVDKKLISLLYLIDETQSVREACSRMQISYSSAWNMLNQAESELDFTLVHRNKGGASGSGSVLTDKGNVLLRAYLEFEAEVRSKAEKLYEHYFEEIT
ncbi:MAG: NTP transferase domain-containing protein [Oscillospiraceae bacterium]|nr:NTP transferase domain-containing protein [Oscillospiraceae bacterium]